MVTIRQQQKTRITVTVDPDVAEFFKAHEFNVSGHVNTYLRKTMENFHRLKSAQDAALIQAASKKANC